MQFLRFNGDGTVTVADSGRRYTASLAAFTFGHNPDGSEDGRVILTPELTPDDGGPPWSCRASLSRRGDRGAQRILLRVLVATGRAASLAAAATTLAAAIEAEGGVVRFDPDQP